MGQRITQLDAAGPLTGAEWFPLVQEGKTKKVQATSFTPLFTGSCQCTLVSRLNTIGTDADTLEKFLQTYQLPTKTLSTNGSWLEIIAWGTFNSNTNKTINLNFGSATLTSGAGTVNNSSWELVGVISRISQTSQKMSLRIISHPSASSWSTTATIVRNGTASEDLDISVPISISAQNGTANANDIIIEGFIVELHQIDVNS